MMQRWWWDSDDDGSNDRGDDDDGDDDDRNDDDDDHGDNDHGAFVGGDAADCNVVIIRLLFILLMNGDDIFLPVPTPPRSVTATAKTSRIIMLRWDVPSATNGKLFNYAIYQVQRSVRAYNYSITNTKEITSLIDWIRGFFYIFMLTFNWSKMIFKMMCQQPVCIFYFYTDAVHTDSIQLIWRSDVEMMSLQTEVSWSLQKLLKRLSTNLQQIFNNT